MSFPRIMPQMRFVAILGFALSLAGGAADAQLISSENLSGAADHPSSQYSSSQDGLKTADVLTAELALPSAPIPASSAAASAGQYGNNGKYGGSAGGHSVMSRLAFEVGGGFNAPQSNSVTYGGQITVGGGLRFSPRLALLAEYQFLDAKLPGYLIAEAGANGGSAHLWSLTLDPVLSLFPKSSNDVYVTGGGGFYRKVTSFTDPSESLYCDYYYGCGYVNTNQVVGHFSSNQGGFNIGAGFQHRLGGMYGEGKNSLFVEARYVDAFTPAVTTQPNGLGTTTVAADTKVIPVSVGIRF